MDCIVANPKKTQLSLPGYGYSFRLFFSLGLLYWQRLSADDPSAGPYRYVCRVNCRCRSWGRTSPMECDHTKHPEDISCEPSTRFLGSYLVDISWCYSIECLWKRNNLWPSFTYGEIIDSFATSDDICTDKKGCYLLGHPVSHLHQSVFYTNVTFIFVFQCSPREKIWNARVPGQCLNVNSIFFFSGAWNILSDISILVLPIHSIFKLHLPTRRKIQVSAVFAVGLL